MRVDKSRWKIRDTDFGPLFPYIQDENVTDINYNGSVVWIDDLTRGRYASDVVLSRDFIEKFTTRVADTVSEQFNKYHPLLEAETDVLRISIIHEEYANTGRSISIRKTPVVRRLNREKMINEEYCSAELLDFMQKCIAAKMNMLMCGLPGTGKTEFLKYLTGEIPAEDRVITIEDNLEIHYSEINPGKDCVELKVGGNDQDETRFSYVTAIKACLRQNPQWILLSEARSTEVKYLLESMSTGTHCLTTLHTDDVRKVPDRIKNMVQDSVIAARIENDVYAFLNAAILIRKTIKDGRIHRYIDQMCFFSREEGGKNEAVMVVENGKFVNAKLPEQILNKFAQAKIFDPLEGVSVSVDPEKKETAPAKSASAPTKEEVAVDQAPVAKEKGETDRNFVVSTEPSSVDEEDPAEVPTDEEENAPTTAKAAETDNDDDQDEMAPYLQNVLFFDYVAHKEDDEARVRRAKKNHK